MIVFPRWDGLLPFNYFHMIIFYSLWWVNWKEYFYKTFWLMKGHRAYLLFIRVKNLYAMLLNCLRHNNSGHTYSCGSYIFSPVIFENSSIFFGTCKESETNFFLFKAKWRCLWQAPAFLPIGQFLCFVYLKNFILWILHKIILYVWDLEDYFATCIFLHTLFCKVYLFAYISHNFNDI